MPTIHPTAVVDPNANIAESAIIGPFCVIGPKVRLADNVKLQSHVVLDGPLNIGENTEIYPGAVLGKRTQDLKYAGGEGPVQIGADCIIREYVTIHQPTTPDGLTRIGDRCAILAYSHIAHDCRLGNGIIMSNSTNLAGHVIVEDDVVFGGLGGAHQFVRIGRGAMVGAMAKVVQDIVPFCLVEGNPASPRAVNKVGMERHNFSKDSITVAQQAFKTIFRSDMRLEQAIEAIREKHGDDPCAQIIVGFLEADSNRGIARPQHPAKEKDPIAND
jgi:UDP-N-acetylglucosamine acyltransferase